MTKEKTAFDSLLRGEYRNVVRMLIAALPIDIWPKSC